MTASFWGRGWSWVQLNMWLAYGGIIQGEEENALPEMLESLDQIMGLDQTKV